jgi:hypothetical protein
MRHLPYVLAMTLTAGLSAQAIQLPYFNSYSFVNLGSAPGVVTNYGGVAFRALEPNVLYIMGGANVAGGVLYKIAVNRDPNKHITGFIGTATQVATAANNDGGLQFGPNDVAFYTRYPLNQLGQIKQGSTATDKVISLSPGVTSSVGALSFIPAGYPGTGKIKLASYNANSFHTGTIVPDTSGTYDLTNIVTGSTIQGGVEGFIYLPPGSPLFTDFNSMLVCEFGSGGVFAYDVDANSDPIPATRRPFMTGLGGAEGAAIDPLSGDFVFSTYGASNSVIAVRGFGLPCGAIVNYGAGTPGTGNQTPALTSSGCFARNQKVTIDVGNGRGGALGALLMGTAQQSVVILGVTVLVVPFAPVNHMLGGASGVAGAGTWSLPLTIPNDTNLLNADFFFQSVYFDPAAAQGISATAGLKLQVR